MMNISVMDKLHFGSLSWFKTSKKPQQKDPMEIVIPKMPGTSPVKNPVSVEEAAELRHDVPFSWLA